MSHRLFNSICTLGCVITIGLLASAPVAGQARSSAAKAVTKPWTQPRTTDGQPDLQGTWTNATITPFERPGNLAGEVFDLTCHRDRPYGCRASRAASN